MAALLWSSWQRATPDLTELLPSGPGVYMFGLVVSDRGPIVSECQRHMDVVYIGVGGSHEGGLAARLYDHLNGRCHIPFLDRAIRNRTAFVSWLEHSQAYALEPDLIRMYSPMANTTHNPHPRILANDDLEPAIRTPVVEDSWQGKTYIPAVIRTLLRGQLTADYLRSRKFAVISEADHEDLQRLLRVSAIDDASVDALHRQRLKETARRIKALGPPRFG